MHWSQYVHSSISAQTNDLTLVTSAFMYKDKAFKDKNKNRKKIKIYCIQNLKQFKNSHVCGPGHVQVLDEGRLEPLCV